MERTTECRCSRDHNNESDSLLKLPDDLTPYTKIVLNKIYKKFKNDLQEYETSIRSFVLTQKVEMKHYIECLVSNTTSEPLNPDERVLHVSGQHENDNGHAQEARAPSENPEPAEITNNACCPHTQPDIRQQFTNNIRELNHILESLLCRRETERERPTRNIGNAQNYEDTVSNPLRHNVVTSSCPYHHHSRSVSKKRK